MEWIERLNNVINYIEEHLTDEIDPDEISKIAGCSYFHYQRMFSYMADLSLSEYIRRRKMSKAAVDLQDFENKVLDISFKYGYDSPTAFNRAFQRVHGIAPSEVRKGCCGLKAYPPISFKISIKGDCVMDYRIEKKEAFRIVGVSAPLEKEIEKNFEAVPAMWGQAHENGTIGKLAAMMDGDLKGLLGVSSCNEKSDWKYYIVVESHQSTGDEFEELIVPQATWAIFTGRGSNITIQELEKRIVTEWFPTSGYEYGNAPDIEVYINPDPNDALYEVWIPVVRK